MKNKYTYNLNFTEKQRELLKNVAQKNNTTMKEIIFSAVDYLIENDIDDIKQITKTPELLEFSFNENNQIIMAVDNKKLHDYIKELIAQNPNFDDRYRVQTTHLIRAILKAMNVEITTSREANYDE